MTERQRYIATLTYRHPDKVPFDPGHGRKSTREAWHRQGLPADVTDINAHVRKLLGMPPADQGESVWLSPDLRMIPQFEEKVIERRPTPAGSAMRGTLVVQDWKGNICEISDEFDVSYLRHAIDFVTRSWIKCPVESRSDWQEMKKRYNPDDPARFAPDFAEKAAKCADRSRAMGFGISGPFWQMREWLGFEGLCMTFHDDPALIEDMVEFYEEFVSRLLDKLFRVHVPDSITINEDMAYKEKPMISPAMARKYLMRSWRRWGEQCRKAGVPIYEVDSDGHVGELIPVFIDGGFNLNSPLEVAAGNDLPAYSRKYGTKMAYRGGVDKRAMAKGGQAIRDEIDRLKPVIEAGGFIPSCDHGIPSDVSWPNFVNYCELLAKATGWL